MPLSSTSPSLSVILPASNEAALIGGCLDAVLASDWDDAAPLDCVVVANGCRDDTAAIARQRTAAFAGRGWDLTVLDLEQGGKLNALNHGDATARAGSRVYLDADVTIAPTLLTQLRRALDTDAPRYASGDCVIAPARSWFSRAYARIYRQVPFMTHGVPGCGVFAVNAAGRARWGAFPDIISDDTFVRLSFRPDERVKVPARYDWPIVEGLKNLIRVRRRQDKGVREIEARFPELLDNDDKPAFPTSHKLAMALRDPLGFAVYAGVALAVKLGGDRSAEWSRGR
ncbi:glycosyltransferase [Mesobacterium sp. TK19101]|uniref:Glycosyltransferase n=1 Tax=Mesobacterium hydrothermale TaxID=3111907 RepID=A0ABU6HHJ4_9RHOB|nr:glycosyltransferase [Mesobacterium sp. TK19101]MEC3861295.1 glycosyltransferase [Mesobacterium sp. TK19101]